MSQLTQYIIALTNLYGEVHKDKVVEIYNEQNEDQISVDEVEEILTDPPEDIEKAFIHTHKGYFVHEAIMEDNEFEIIMEKKKNKPYYIPQKQELLKYIDEIYFEKTKEYYALLNYMQKNFFDGDEEKAKWLCQDIQGLCKVGGDLPVVMDFLEDRGFIFEGVNQINEALQLVMGFTNNTRIWENNGHTPQEIFEKFEKPNLNPLPDKPFVMDMETREKVGRNDPCPCGSGKKHKKCCLGKDE